MHLFNLYFLSFNSFYDRLNEVGKLVFYIVLLLFLILIVLIIIAVLQNNTNETIRKKKIRILREDEKKLDIINKQDNSKMNISVDETNEKTRDLKKIVDQIKMVTEEPKKDIREIYEDEQERNAVISYSELIKGNIDTDITIPKEETYTVSEHDNNEAFLRSLKEFRRNL